MDELTASLPLPHRLAASYSPRRARADALAILALDARLAAILRGQGEALLAQIRLAWWRDRLGEGQESWPQGEPLLALLRTARLAPDALIPLVDGWEGLVGDELTAFAIDRFAQGRALAWAGLARAHGHPQAESEAMRAAREWTYLDLALHLGNPAEARAARQLARACAWSPLRLPRPLRALAVLHGLARRALEREAGDLLGGPGDGLVALRIGLVGR